MASRRKKPKAAKGKAKRAGKRVACTTCMKEVPKADAVVPEAMEHVRYFCGLRCYEAWVKELRMQDSHDIRRAVEDGMQDLRMGKRP